MEESSTVNSQWPVIRNKVIPTIVKIAQAFINSGYREQCTWLLGQAKRIQKEDNFSKALYMCGQVHNTVLSWGELLQGDGQAGDGIANFINKITGKNDDDNTELINYICDCDDYLCQLLGQEDGHQFGETQEVTKRRIELAVENTELIKRLTQGKK